MNVSQSRAGLATTAVLETNELIHQILAQVPLGDRVAIRRVSKTWKQVISKIGYQVVPVEDEYWRKYPPGSTPHYLEHDVKINPILMGVPSTDARWARCSLTGLGYPKSDNDWINVAYEVFFSLAGQGAILLGFGQQFITSPPITRVKLRQRFSGAEGTTTRILEAREGLRLVDLSEKSTGMYYTSEGHFSYRLRVDRGSALRMKDGAARLDGPGRFEQIDCDY